MLIYVQHGSEQLGPFTEEQLKAQLGSGTISLQDHVWWEGQAGWVLLSQTQFGNLLPPGGLTGASPIAPVFPPTTAPTSKLAIWALVCGCLSFFFSLLTSIPAIILGHLALKETKQNPAIKGHGMALAGTILGYVFTLLLPVISIIAISVLIALGNQVKDTFNTINAQQQATNSASSSTNQNTPASSPDQSTNSAPATTNAAPNSQ